MPPKFTFQLDAEAVMSDPKSYALNEAGRELVLRAFMFQNGGIYSRADPDKKLGKLTADDLDWASKEKVGHGASGSVYCVKIKDDPSRIIAVKCIPISSKTHRDEVERELNFLLSKYDSQFIVETYGAFWDGEEHTISIPMEWMAFSLADVSKFNEGVGEEAVRAIAFQLLHDVAYLHETKNVIHRDLKPGNVLMNAEGFVKLGDFGVSKVVQTLNVSSTYVGTMLFMAPERLEQGEYTFSSDVWSLGLTLVAAATGRNPWAPPEDLNLFQLLKKISGDEIPQLPSTFTSEAQDFMRQCLQREPEERPSCRTLLQHPFVADVTFEASREACKMLLLQTSRLVSSAAAKQQLESPMAGSGGGGGEEGASSPTYSDDFHQ